MERIWLEITTVWSWLFEHSIYINLLFSIIIVFFQRRDPKSVWTWLLALYFIPVFGILLYLLLGQDFRKNKMFRVKEVEDRMRYSAKSQENYFKYHDASLEGPLARDYQDLVMYNLETSGAVMTVDNEVEIFIDGEKKYADLRTELSNARHFIHLQYYIIKDDELFDSLRPILIERAAAGVEVRILSDGMGGRFMPKKKWEEMRANGVKTAVFFPALLGRLNFRVNYRNHRKIVVIDGKIGYVGGFNIGREYISKDPKFGYWRDTHLKIRGSAALSLEIRFALDWNYAAGENLFKYPKYFCPDEDWDAKGARPEPGLFYLEQMETSKRPLGIQIIASGPDASFRQIRDNYMRLFSKAHHHIYIQTPYFVPDDAVLSTLQMAAHSGVDVRLMIPCKPDHPFVYWATYSYVGDLLSAGARCYTYENGFLHAKGVMIDGLVSSYGTANMDIRSFELNFEVNAVLYDEETTKELEDIFLEDLTRCREITQQIYADRSLWIRLKEQCSRLLSPLL